MRNSGYRIAIVNPTTLVGNELKTILHERGIPYAHIELIDTTGEAAGTLTEVANEAAVVTAASEEAFAGVDLAFFCGRGEQNEKWINREEGFTIDLSQPTAAEGQGIAVVAGVNDDQMQEGVVAISPHPVAVPIALVIHALQKVTKIRLCAVSAIQPASEMGQEGVDELFQQTVAALNMKSIPKEVFDRQLAFNLFPAVNAAASEGYVTTQIRQVLGWQSPVSVTLTQGTLFHGYALTFFVQTEDDLDEEAITAALRKSSALEIAEPDDDYTTIDAAGKDQVLIGRIRRDRDLPNSFWIWAVVDNLRRSSALNAVLIAESMFSKFGEKPN